MQLNKKFKIVFSLILFFLCLNTQASHVVGGNVGYEYIGPSGAGFEYNILFTVYYDCGPTSNVTVPDPTQTIGIYTHDLEVPLFSPMDGGNKTRIQF